MIDLLTHPVILECIERGVVFSVHKGYIKIDGFYKSGDCRLTLSPEGFLIAHMRYDEKEAIKSFRDLVELNYSWWQQYKNSYNDRSSPEQPWAEFMVEFGLVSKSVMQIIEYKSIERNK